MKLPEEKKKFIELIEKGVSVTKVCQMLNIHRSTFYDWKNNNVTFAKHYMQAKSICHEETSDAASYHYHKFVREGNPKFLMKWLNEQHPEFVQKPLRVLLHKVGDHESGLVSLTNDELFRLIHAYQNAGYSANETLEEKLKEKYLEWLLKNDPSLLQHHDPHLVARHKVYGDVVRHSIEKHRLSQEDEEE